jgi:hypothetical protein
MAATTRQKTNQNSETASARLGSTELDMVLAPPAEVGGPWSPIASDATLNGW